MHPHFYWLAVLVERDSLDESRSALEPPPARAFRMGPGGPPGVHEVKRRGLDTQAHALELRARNLGDPMVLTQVQGGATVQHRLPFIDLHPLEGAGLEVEDV